MKRLCLLICFVFCLSFAQAGEKTIIGTGQSQQQANADAAKRLPNRPFLVTKTKSYKISVSVFVTEITIWKD